MKPEPGTVYYVNGTLYAVVTVAAGLVHYFTPGSQGALVMELADWRGFEFNNARRLTNPRADEGIGGEE